MMVFAIYQHESATGIHVSSPPHPEPSSYLPLHPIPLGNPPSSLPYPSVLSQSTRFACPASRIKLVLAVYFTYGNTHVSVLFSQVIPPLPSPTESLYLCLFCCLAYRVVVTIFLNSIYMCQYTVLMFFFLTYFTLYNRLQFHPPH